MSSHRERVMQAVLSALSGASKPADLTVTRSRAALFASDRLPVQVPFPGQETVEMDDLGGQVLRRLRLRVATRAEGDPPEAAADGYTEWAITALLSDPTLGGLALQVTEAATEWDVALAEEVFGAVLQEFEIQYLTPAAAPDE